MKTSAFLIFIIIALLIYGTINFYIYRRAWMALTDTGIYKYIFLYLFLFLVFAFPLGRFLEPFFRNKITDFLVYIGSFYLGIMVYALLLIIVIDIFRISNNFFHFF